MGEALVLRRGGHVNKQAREEPQATRPRGGGIPQAAGGEHQGTAGARESAGSDEAGIGSCEKPASHGGSGGALRAAEAKAQAEASRSLTGADMAPGVNRGTFPVHAVHAYSSGHGFD